MRDAPSVQQPTGWRAWFVRRRVKYVLTWKARFAIAALAVAATVGPGRALLPALAGALVVDDRPLASADLIVAELTENPSFAVLRHADALRRAGLAPRVALTRYSAERRLEDGGVLLPSRFDRILQAYATEAGLPDTALDAIPVRVEDPVTWNTARQVVEHCAAAGVHRIIVVGPPFHSRRSSWSYRHFGDLRGVTVQMSPAWAGLTARNWWQTKDGILVVGQELGKIAWYTVRGRR